MSSASSSASSSGSSAPNHAALILQYLNDFEPHRYPTGAALQLGPGHAGHRHSFADRTRRLWSPHSPRPPSGTALTASSGSLGSAVSRPMAHVDRPHHVRGQQRYYQPPCRTSSLGPSAPPPPTPRPFGAPSPMVSHGSRVVSPLAGVTEASPGVVSALSLQESAFGGPRGEEEEEGEGWGTSERLVGPLSNSVPWAPTISCPSRQFCVTTKDQMPRMLFSRRERRMAVERPAQGFGHAFE